MEKLNRDGTFDHESFEEYAEHSLMHDDMPDHPGVTVQEHAAFSSNLAIYDRLGLVHGE